MIDEVTHADQASIEGARSGSLQPDTSALHGGDREDRGVEMIAHLVGQHAQGFVGACRVLEVEDGLPPYVPRRNGGCDRVVEPHVQLSELGNRDLLAFFVGKLGNRLAEIAVIMNDLIDAEPVPQQLLAVKGCGASNPVIIAGDVCALRQHAGELIDEDRHAVFELERGRARSASHGDAITTASDQFRPI